MSETDLEQGEIKGKGPHDLAARLERIGRVRALVNDQEMIVRSGAWDPITSDGETTPHYFRARAIRSDLIDVEAKGTPFADAPTQVLIDQIKWELPPSEDSPSPDAPRIPR